jgi:hypothetical protein
MNARGDEGVRLSSPLRLSLDALLESLRGPAIVEVPGLSSSKQKKLAS